MPNSKLHSISAVANLLAHNNKSQICYCGQISLQSAAVNCSFSDTFGGNIYFAGDGTPKIMQQSPICGLAQQITSVAYGQNCNLKFEGSTEHSKIDVKQSAVHYESMNTRVTTFGTQIRYLLSTKKNTLYIFRHY